MQPLPPDRYFVQPRAAGHQVEYARPVRKGGDRITSSLVLDVSQERAQTSVLPVRHLGRAVGVAAQRCFDLEALGVGAGLLGEIVVHQQSFRSRRSSASSATSAGVARFASLAGPVGASVVGLRLHPVG